MTGPFRHRLFLFVCHRMPVKQGLVGKGISAEFTHAVCVELSGPPPLNVHPARRTNPQLSFRWFHLAKVDRSESVGPFERRF